MSTTFALTAALVLMAPPTPVKGVTSATHARAPDCQVTLIDEAQVPAREAGALVLLDATENRRVKLGDVLARIDDRNSQTKKEVAALDFEAAQAQATNQIRIQAAIAGSEVAQAEWRRSLDTNRKNPGTISEMQLKKEELAAKHAKLQIDLARHEFAVAGMTSKAKKAQVNAAELEIERSQIVAPLDGVVVQLYKHKGEWVSPGDPVLRIVRMDKLRVEGFLNADDYLPIDVAGRPVTIEVQLTNKRVERLTGKLEFVSTLVEGSGFRIWADVDNRLEGDHWVLLPGMTATMSIALDSPANAAPARALKTTSK